MARPFCYELGMRIAVVALLFAVAACQAAQSQPAPSESASTTQVVAASTPAPEPAHACGPSCGGQCGGQCEGMADPPAPPPVVPADAVWTELKVSGMHCGGCARRIRNALAQVEGVYGVDVDLATATVRVATAKGKDGRALAGPRIDALGYHVQ